MKCNRTLFFCLLAAAAMLMSACQGKLEPTPGVVPIEKTYVYFNDKYATLDRNAASFTSTLPTATDFSEIKVRVRSDADQILLDGREFDREGEVLDLREPKTLRFVFEQTYQDYTLSIRNTGLPVVRVTTPAAVTSKENWMEGAAMRIELPDGTVDYEGPMSIRGRGNSTWNYPKKPYALKLDAKAEILGFPSHKRWILLANWKDRTLLRNDAAFWLSSHTGLPYTVRGKFVELELNGRHMGNYYLCEQIKINKNRVNVKDGGYLIELDSYFDEVNRFKSPRFDLPWMVKEPDEEELTPEAFQQLKDWVAALEDLLKDEARVQAHEYEQYLDVDTAIDYLIVEELTMNHDFYNTWPAVGPHSTYLYLQPGGKLYTGPVWDFDYHSFVPDRTNFWAGANKTMYYPALLKDEKFRNRLIERWEAQKDELRKLPDYIDAVAEQIALSEAINASMWPIDNRENGDETMSWSEAVQRMKSSFVSKWNWMDTNIRNLR